MIHEDRQVEFFGKAYYIPKPPFDLGDPTSIYELWISKANGLPYKMRREMSHQISATTCSDVVLNQLSIADFNLYDYVPQDYETVSYTHLDVYKRQVVLLLFTFLAHAQVFRLAVYNLDIEAAVVCIHLSLIHI